MTTINTTIKLQDAEQAHYFELHLREMFPENVIDYKVLPDTEELYKTNPHFKKIVDEERKRKKAKSDFIHKYNK